NGGNNGSATVTAGGGTSPYAYAWSNGTTTAVNNNLAAGTYTVTVTDSAGCISTDQAQISQASTLTATIQSSSNVTCFGGDNGSATILVSGGISPYYYLWSNSTASATDSSLSAGSYTVTVTDTKNCSAISSFTITQPDQLVVIASADDTVCNGTYATIGATAFGGNPGYVFNWDNGVGTGEQHSLQIFSTTTFIVSVTDTNGCSSSPASVTIYTNAPLTLSDFTPSAICEGDQTTLSTTVSGGVPPYAYVWSNGIGAANPPVSVSPSVTTTYFVTVTDACGSLPATDSATVVVSPKPVPDFTLDNKTGCGSLTVNITENTIPPHMIYEWTFGDSASLTSNISYDQNPSHFYANAGEYTISLSLTSLNGCTAEYHYPQAVIVYPNPVAAFITTPQDITISEPYVAMVDQSINATHWTWDFDDPNSGGQDYSTEKNPGHLYNEVGEYHIKLFVENDNGCKDTAVKEVVVTDFFTFFAPNAFTPDGDGLNDFYMPVGTNLDKNGLKFEVYDRWDKLQYESSDWDKPWDGKFSNGQMANPGVYTWQIFFKEINGNPHTYRGTVMLIR
ncbi:MAG: PKD domain-containing protein, partial [Bacteroidota bacterium]